MSLTRFLSATPTVWPALVLVTLAARVAFGSATILPSEYAAWFFLAGAPVVIALVVMRNKASQTIAQVLYDAERAHSPAETQVVRDRLRGFAADDREKP